MRFLFLSAATFVCALACVPELALPAGAQLACKDGADCPSESVCVQDVGVCEPKGSACVTAVDDGFAAAADGNACTQGTARGECRRGVCSIPRCGNGVLDDGEQCDDGGDNADVASTCRTTCRLPVCGDHIVDDGEQCDGEQAPFGTCTRGCFLFCEAGHADVDGELENGCEESSTLIGRALETPTIVADEVGNVWWTDVGDVEVLPVGQSEPLTFIPGTFALGLHVAHGVVATGGLDVLVVDIESGTIFEPFPLLGAPGCREDTIPFDFAECITFVGVDAAPVARDEIIVMASDLIVWHKLDLAKSTRVLATIGDGADFTRLVIHEPMALVGSSDGRVFEIRIDGTAPARVIVEGQPSITAIAADSDDVFWLNTVDGTVGRYHRASGTSTILLGGDAPGRAIVLAGDDVLFAVDSGTADRGRIFIMKRDGSGLRVHSSAHDDVTGLAVFGNDLFWADAGFVQEAEVIVSGVHRVPIRVTP